MDRVLLFSMGRSDEEMDRLSSTRWTENRTSIHLVPDRTAAGVSGHVTDDIRRPIEVNGVSDRVRLKN